MCSSDEDDSSSNDYNDLFLLNSDDENEITDLSKKCNPCNYGFYYRIDYDIMYESEELERKVIYTLSK